MHYGLLGRNLSHSYSPQIHNALVDYDYALMEIEPEYLETFMQTANFRGINVTIPYKKAVLPYCKMTVRFWDIIQTILAFRNYLGLQVLMYKTKRFWSLAVVELV